RLSTLAPPLGLMTLTRTVPAAVPSLSHSWRPWTPSLAVKKATPLTFVRLSGDELAVEGLTTSKADGTQRHSNGSRLNVRVVRRRRGTRPRRERDLRKPPRKLNHMMPWLLSQEGCERARATSRRANQGSAQLCSSIPV